MVGAAGPYAPSPIPTNRRVASNIPNVTARPDAPLARLHNITLTPIKSQRDIRSASQPRKRRGNHVANKKGRAERAGLRHCIDVVRRKKSGANLRFDRRENLAIDVVEKINSEQKRK